jgi:hypothetical protein
MPRATRSIPVIPGIEVRGGGSKVQGRPWPRTGKRFRLQCEQILEPGMFGRFRQKVV